MKKEIGEAKYNVLDIASFVANKYKDEYGKDISYYKLHSLLYFIQAFFLVKKNRPCFEEELVAWGYGPVSEEVHDKFGNEPRGERIEEIKKGSVKLSLEEDEEDIRAVIKEFKDSTVKDLREIIWKQEPWKKANKDKDKIIRKDVIKDYFEEERDKYKDNPNKTRYLRGENLIRDLIDVIFKGSNEDEILKRMNDGIDKAKEMEVDSKYLFEVISEQKCEKEDGYERKLKEFYEKIDNSSYKNKKEIKKIAEEKIEHPIKLKDIIEIKDKAVDEVSVAEIYFCEIKEKVSKIEEGMKKDMEAMEGMKKDMEAMEGMKKDMEAMEGMKKDIITQLVSLVTIFTTLAFLLFGGTSFLNGIFEAFSGESEFKILFMVSCWGLAFSSVFHLFIYFIFCMIGKEGKDKFYVFILWVISVVVLVCINIAAYNHFS